MKRLQLRSKDIHEPISRYGIIISKKDSVELLEDGRLRLIILNRRISFFYHGATLVPTLSYILAHPNFSGLKQAVVDMGAIPHLIAGSDIMRPGLTSYDPQIESGDYVLVTDQTHHRPISIAQAIISGADFSSQTHGKTLKNIHYIGDPIWSYKI